MLSHAVHFLNGKTGKITRLHNLEICIKCLEKVHKDHCRSNIHYKFNEQEYSWHYSTCGKLNNEKKYLELILENEDRTYMETNKSESHYRSERNQVFTRSGKLQITSNI